MEGWDSWFTLASLLVLVAFEAVSLCAEGYAVVSVLGTFAWACFFHVLREIIETQFPKTRAIVDPSDPQWSKAAAYVSFLHEFVVCLGFGIYFLALFNRDVLWWGESIMRPSWTAHRPEEHLFYATMGYDIKDFFKSRPNIGFVIHHIFTILACVLTLLTPAGLGLVAVNCVQAQLGSGFYNLYVFLPTTAMFWAFVVFMTASNAIGLWLLAKYIGFDMPVVWKICYGIMVCGLCILRQGNVFMLLGKRAQPGKKPEGTGGTEKTCEIASPTATTPTASTPTAATASDASAASPV